MSLILSQLAVYVVLHYLHLVDLCAATNILFVCVMLFMTAFVEAFTCDNDNLILPLVSYPFMLLLTP